MITAFFFKHNSSNISITVSQLRQPSCVNEWRGAGEGGGEDLQNVIFSLISPLACPIKSSQVFSVYNNK